MDIRAKFYPYPVLSHFSDDYVGSEYKTIIGAEKVGHNIQITISAEIENEGLKHLVETGQATLAYHLECAQTGYRKVLSSSDEAITHIILNGLISGKLQICPFIVATTDIPDYVNDSFHEDYRGFKFDIETGCVMAVGRQVNINIDKEVSDLANTGSVFSILKNEDENAMAMLVDLDFRKIVIKLPEEDFFNYQSLRGEAIIQPVLNSMVIIPALVYVLEEVARRDARERYEYSSYSWFRTIKKSLAQNFDYDIEDNEFSERNMLELAQKLINFPLSDSLQTLSSGYSHFGEEEDE